MKTLTTLCILAAVALTQTGCATQMRTVPLPAASAIPQNTDVALYFGAQPHPAVVHTIGPASIGARLGRAPGEDKPNCDRVLIEALNKLRLYAHDHHGNAVINIKTNFHQTETVSTSAYTCGVSPSAVALRVSGDVVVLGAQ